MPQGTFTAASQSVELEIHRSASLSLAFEGGGTVKLQRHRIGDWRDIPDAEWSADTEDSICNAGAPNRYRLLCTAYVADIHWEIG